MKEQIKKLLAQKGQEPVIMAIENSARDLKKSGYDRQEIKETIKEWFYGLDGKIDFYIDKRTF